MDEMEMKKEIRYDKGLHQFLGFISPDLCVTEEDKGTVASKALVFVVKGLSLKWKQTVAYFFVGTSIDTSKLWECIQLLIHKLHNEGLKVHGIASDMGPVNRGLWNFLNVHAVDGSTRNVIPHPVEVGAKLYFSADIAHLLKNLWTSMTQQDIILPPEIVAEHPEWGGHSVVSAKSIAKLIDLQEQPRCRGITMQYKLRKYHVQPSHLEKMKVRYAAEFFSRSTATALMLCAMREDIPEIDHRALPTAWFLEQVNQWFDIINDRRFGISAHDNGDRKISELGDFVRLIKVVTFGRRGWKPIQTGMILSTTTVINLHADLVINGPFLYLLPGRMTTDCLENLFAQVRQVGSHHPGPVETRLALRLISVGQFFYVPKSSNYEDDDDDEYVVEMLRKSDKPEREAVELHDEDYQDVELPTVLQQQGLYNIAGWIAHKLSSELCHTCMALLISEAPLDDSASEWTTMVSRGGLTHPSASLHDLVLFAERVFSSLQNTLLHVCTPIETFIDTADENVNENLRESLAVDCGHDLIRAVLEKFIKLRVHVFADDLSRKIPKERGYAGRACFMATAADALNRY